jgi:hypothetical protein
MEDFHELQKQPRLGGNPVTLMACRYRRSIAAGLLSGIIAEGFKERHNKDSLTKGVRIPFYLPAIPKGHVPTSPIREHLKIM